MESMFVCTICRHLIPERRREHENTDWCTRCLEAERMRHHEANHTTSPMVPANCLNYVKYPHHAPQNVREEVLAFGNSKM